MGSSDLKYNRRAQLDRLLGELRGKIPVRPKTGWIAEIRSALQMTTAQLARRVGVAQSVVSNFEKSERQKTITLQSLEKIAQSLECELHYVLIPKKGLEQELYERARALHEQRMKKIEHHMRLEGQGTSAADDARKMLEILKLYRDVWKK